LDRFRREREGQLCASAGQGRQALPTDEEVRVWAEDEKAAKEGRAATFYRDGYAEVISRGPAVEPPGGQ
jgi:hypothetical protein